ncbi:MAG TPA: helix-turn-helix transcriptional regulator [Thermoanaerobaculia bacterium]|nr:helix-turn-helix transcriptional regulator [Thermoanaerobaculia bacterium]
MTHAPLLINELERIRRERAWTVVQIAQRIGVSAKLFYNMRLGHRPLSVGTLSEIARAFGADYRVREAVMHYLALEYQTFGRDILRKGKGSASTRYLPETISYHNRWRIVTWIGRLPFGEGVQRGLYLVAAEPGILSAVSRFVADATGDSGLGVLTIAGNTRPSASHTAAAIAANVLIVDRIDFASEDVSALIARRADAQKPTVVTSCIDRDTLSDGPLLRALRTATELVRLDAVPSAKASKRATPTRDDALA